MRDDEFFIGWQGKAPPETAAYLKGIVGLGLGIVLVLAVLAPILQETVSDDASFDYGNHREFSGVLVKDPVPMLVGDDNAIRLLVNPFKHGFDRDLAAKFHLRHVTLRGTLISRGGDEMVEVLPESLTVTDEPGEAEHPLGEATDLGETVLRGEIVDSKCYLGVMNPGNLKPHRACAINCIQGGVPPVLLVRNREGEARYVLLVGENGEAVNAAVLELVAEPVEVRGRLRRRGKQLVLYADPEAIRVE
jgi:uncharacterized membrane protein